MKGRSIGNAGGLMLLAGGAAPAQAGPVDPQVGRITAQKNKFVDASGAPWSYRGVSSFLLFYRYLLGEDIEPVVRWAASLGANTLRVLGMVNWPDKGQTFGPGITPNWWPDLVPFVDYLGAHGLRVEFTVFASAQDILPSASAQREHLRKVIDAIGAKWNVLIEIANEPWQNGCDPVAIFSASEPRPCPMAYGLYDIVKSQRADGTWIGELPVLDYVTPHTPRDPEAWSRKAKDLAEYRDGSGDGTENAPLYAGAHLACVGDEPMGAAEAEDLAGRQRSNIPQDFFWYSANAAINGGGSTFHCDAGLQAVVPAVGGDEQACAEAYAMAWQNVPPEFQTGSYTRGGLPDLPMVWDGAYFPEQTSRIYGRILGGRAMCVAIKPLAGWVPQAMGGWRIVRAIGPMASLVELERV